MDPTQRIIKEFDRLVSRSNDITSASWQERTVFYIVVTRCEIDMNGFCSVFEQALGATELGLVIDGLDAMEEHDLAGEFRHGYALLQAEGFYSHMNWNKVSATVKAEIKVLGGRVGARLWDLDAKLVGLLDGNAHRGGC